MRNMKFLMGFLVLGLASAAEAQERAPVEFIVAPGEASAVPFKQAVSWANGGVIDVAQPNPTTLIVTMSGITATNADLVRTSVANYRFQLTQGFAVAFNSPQVQVGQADAGRPRHRPAAHQPRRLHARPRPQALSHC